MSVEAASPARLLEVRGLVVLYSDEAGARRPVVDGFELGLDSGESVGIVGESGSGKTTLALSLLGLLPAGARVAGGSIRFRGRELLGLSEPALEGLRGSEIALVSQEPGIALNPVMRVGDQVAEVLRAHRPMPREQRRQEVHARLAEVGLSETQRICAAYPHELSGGQQQRVAIAQAVACRPSLLVADEPTSALDTTTQADLLALLRDLQERLGLAVLLVTHDLAVLGVLAQRVLVMYAGQLVEEGPLERVRAEPLHPYTRALLAALPRPRAAGEPRRLPVALASSPDATVAPSGCRFEPRCPDRMEHCRVRLPPPVAPEPGRRVRCFLYGE